ncbi:MAG: NADP-dependent oxidoreductase [Alicyclobacillaceae bacterium]|nr:NADP-dependent oxidoreductase [Alicyclobacillaceae bacterium]
MAKNIQVQLASRPRGMPTLENFRFVEIPIPSAGPGEIVVKTLYLSVDPYMRGRMNDAKSYVPPYPLDEVITGGVVGQVVESRHPSFSVGDIVVGTLGWQHYSLSNGEGLRKIDPSTAPISTALGILGMPGLTAYFGLLDIGRPKAGETVVISGAAGAVGSTAGQIAKLKGCRVVGIAGSDAKIAYLKEELGFDAGINYKTAGNLVQAIQEACPEGVDVYFDNVGGEITDAVITHLNDHARIVLCGQIALYNLEKPDLGPRPFPRLLIRRVLVKGFIVSDYADRIPEAAAELTGWFTAGKLKYRETVVEGLENAPRAFIGLFHGENIGKQLVKVADPQ